MYAIIGGSGRLGASLAGLLAADGNDVVVIADPDQADRMETRFDGVVVEGDSDDPLTLERAGIKRADLFVAATNDDNVNAAAVLAARDLFSVPLAIARITDPERSAFYEELGYQTICPTTTGVNQVISLLRDRAIEPLRALIDPAALCIVPPEEWIGVELRNLSMPKGWILLGLIRGKRLCETDRRLSVRADDGLVLARTGGR